jgi:hypothetical protein
LKRLVGRLKNKHGGAEIGTIKRQDFEGERKGSMITTRESDERLREADIELAVSGATSFVDAGEEEGAVSLSFYTPSETPGRKDDRQPT